MATTSAPSLAASTNLLGIHVDAEVDDLEARALEHHRDEVLADVVQVALRPCRSRPGRSTRRLIDQVRPQELERGLHRVRRDEHLGNEDLALLEQLADVAHRRHQARPASRLVDGDAVLEALLHLGDGLGSPGRRRRRREADRAALMRLPLPSGRPRSSLTASYSASRFSTGTPACTLWIGLKTKPPPAPKISQPLANHRPNLVRRAERQHVLRVDAAAPERDPVAVGLLQRARIHVRPPRSGPG